ncbi:MAG: FAD binding domain-containing protein [Pseudomonadota bacterium]|nr:FAD binding domain-containing protein [Pseudomonadota bacterium]
MKPVAFDYARPRSLDSAIELLKSRSRAKIMAGAQTLGPMLNLRLVQPGLLVDITRIPELLKAETIGDEILRGACVSHAAIEDGRTPDVGSGFLRRIARGIAYRAVRTRGTIGGSLAHADPAADWLSALLVLGAFVEIAGTDGRRRVALSDFVLGAMQCDLASDELLAAIRIPSAIRTARFGYHKLCRKTGEFADAIGAVCLSSDSMTLVAGAGSGQPILFRDPSHFMRDGDPANAGAFDQDLAMQSLKRAGHGGDEYELQIQAVAMQRALQEAVR